MNFERAVIVILAVGIFMVSIMLSIFMYLMLDYHYDLKQSLFMAELMKKQQQEISVCGCDDDVINDEGWIDIKGDII